MLCFKNSARLDIENPVPYLHDYEQGSTCNHILPAARRVATFCQAKWNTNVCNMHARTYTTRTNESAMQANRASTPRPNHQPRVGRRQEPLISHLSAAAMQAGREAADKRQRTQARALDPSTPSNLLPGMDQLGIAACGVNMAGCGDFVDGVFVPGDEYGGNHDASLVMPIPPPIPPAPPQELKKESK